MVYGVGWGHYHDHRENHFYMCLYCKKKSLKIFSRISKPISILYKSSLSEFKLIQGKGWVLFKWEIMTKIGWGYSKFSQEPQGATIGEIIFICVYRGTIF
jgi:hypothetical protein